MLSQLIEKKRSVGHLEDADVLKYLRYLRGTGEESSTKWTDETFAELTKFCLGLPTKPGFNFVVVAGEPIERVEMSAAQKTVLSKFAARRARKTTKQARQRQLKKDEIVSL